MEIKILNLCSHVVTVKNVTTGEEVTFQPENKEYPARVQNGLATIFKLGKIDIYKRTEPSNINLPPARDGHLYIVSRPVAIANADRHDLLVPCGLVKDVMGEVQYCTGLEVI